MSSIPTSYKTMGNSDILDSHHALVINSRQGKTPSGSDLWVVNTLKAVERIRDEGHTLVTSVGMNTWELALWAAGECGCKSLILLPEEKNSQTSDAYESICRDFSLKKELTFAVFIPPQPGSRSSKSWWKERDRLACELADSIFPVSIRANGNWDVMITESTEKSIIDDFRTPHITRRKSIPIIPEELKPSKLDTWPYLTHWTKRSHNPWPGEKSADYYSAIAASADEFPRLAIHTLRQILEEGVVRGSGRRIRGGKRIVAFTSEQPYDAIKLMVWRRRLASPTFEPYGIAIRREAATREGIRPVEYLPDMPDAQGTPEHLRQGFAKGNWTRELEWRSEGDIRLGRFNTDELIILVPTATYTERLMNSSKFRMIALESLSESGL